MTLTGNAAEWANKFTNNESLVIWRFKNEKVKPNTLKQISRFLPLNKFFFFYFQLFSVISVGRFDVLYSVMIRKAEKVSIKLILGA